MATKGSYYIPHSTYWPFIGSIGLFTTLLGLVNWLHDNWFGPYLFMVGLLVVVFMLFGWFGTVIQENEAGLYNAQVDRTFRWAMFWFIFSEVMFFAVFFGALFYARYYSVPWLGGEGHGEMSHYVLWPSFKAAWPLMANPDPSQFPGQLQVIETWKIPALNTLILLSSGVTVTWAHWALKKEMRGHLAIGLACTIALGITFLAFQVHEYSEAYTEYALTLSSGIYGTTFFMLTGFHGAHVTVGTIMLIVMLLRSLSGHFTPDNHFAFEAVSWYWHFVDVVWLGLFIFVYWL